MAAQQAGLIQALGPSPTDVEPRSKNDSKDHCHCFFVVDFVTRFSSIEIWLVANESALVETWTMSPTRQSMTVYTLDGDRLLATH